ncbi:MAG: hypothetical protein SGPRY_015080 [Prymnesium sp.]
MSRQIAISVLLLALPAAALVLRPALPLPQRHACASAHARMIPASAMEQRGDNVIKRVFGAVRNAVFLGAASVLVRSPIAPQAIAAKAPPTPPATTKKNDVGASALPGLATIMMGGGLVYWSVRSAEAEDEEEQQRVKDEKAKLDSLAKEYTDIDEGVTVDEDLFASLRSRMNSTETIKGSDEDEGPGGDSSPPGDDPLPPPAPAGGGGSAVLDAPIPDETPSPDEPAPTASAEDIERLNRMFNSGDKS